MAKKTKPAEDMTIELTANEVDTLRFYLPHALIDAEGSHAIGVGNRRSVEDLRSVIKKIGGKPIV